MWQVVWLTNLKKFLSVSFYTSYYIFVWVPSFFYALSFPPFISLGLQIHIYLFLSTFSYRTVLEGQRQLSYVSLASISFLSTTQLQCVTVLS